MGRKSFKRRHRFLTELNIDHRDRDKESIRLNGFDDADTWSLDYTMLCILYERLARYKEIAEKAIELDYHTFEVENEDGEPETKTQREIIDMLLELLKGVIRNDGMDSLWGDADEERKTRADIERIWNLWGVVSPAMWW